MKQQSLSMSEDCSASFQRPQARRTKRELFLRQMEQIVPWVEVATVIEPHYPKAGNGRPPVGLERMLRIHFLQHWFNLADEACEDALYDSAAFRSFVGIDLGSERAPDATTLLKFRRLLEQHQLGEALMARVNAHLKASGVKVGAGTIVDATIIGAPSSTKNRQKQRDPEMHQTKKGNQWYFGMKLHVGADSRSGLVHRAEVTAANTHDSQILPQLMHGKEQRLYGDSAYRGAKQKAAMREAAPQVKDFTNERAHRNAPLSKQQKRKNTSKSSVRAKVEYVFLVIKKLWGFGKVRYRGWRRTRTACSRALRWPTCSSLASDCARNTLHVRPVRARRGATTEFSGHRAPRRRIPGCFQSESFVQDYESGVRSHQPGHQLRTRLNQRLPS